MTPTLTPPASRRRMPWTVAQWRTWFIVHRIAAYTPTALPTQGERWENMQRLAFESLWSEINGADSWRANPWVWALTFKRVAGGAA